MFILQHGAVLVEDVLINKTVHDLHYNMEHAFFFLSKASMMILTFGMCSTGCSISLCFMVTAIYSIIFPHNC